jgi:copper homeostasis protein CutC
MACPALAVTENFSGLEVIECATSSLNCVPKTIDACMAAKEGGAHRIELCTGLSEGGLTPSHGFVKAAIECSSLAVHVLLLLRGGSFQYTRSEVSVMREDIQHVKKLGVVGAAAGLLRNDGCWIARTAYGRRTLLRLVPPQAG